MLQKDSLFLRCVSVVDCATGVPSFPTLIDILEVLLKTLVRRWPVLLRTQVSGLLELQRMRVTSSWTSSDGLSLLVNWPARVTLVMFTPTIFMSSCLHVGSIVSKLRKKDFYAVGQLKCLLRSTGTLLSCGLGM